MIIRPFARPDYQKLVESIDTVCAEGMMATPFFQPTGDWQHALAETGCLRHLLLVVEDAGNVIGWCRVFPENDHNGTKVTLGIGLLPAYRDRGIGTALVRYSLQWAAHMGYRYIHLTTRADNARAIRVFSRCGFSFTGIRCGDLLEMACFLPRPKNRRGEIYENLIALCQTCYSL